MWTLQDERNSKMIFISILWYVWQKLIEHTYCETASSFEYFLWSRKGINFLHKKIFPRNIYSIVEKTKELKQLWYHEMNLHNTKGRCVGWFQEVCLLWKSRLQSRCNLTYLIWFLYAIKEIYIFRSLWNINMSRMTIKINKYDDKVFHPPLRLFRLRLFACIFSYSRDASKLFCVCSLS